MPRSGWVLDHGIRPTPLDSHRHAFRPFETHGPLMAIDFLLVVAARWLLSLGLIGEILTRVYFEASRARTYAVARLVRGKAAEPTPTTGGSRISVGIPRRFAYTEALSMDRAQSTLPGPQQESVPRTGETILLVRAGGFLCALPISRVAEVLRPLEIERLSGVPPFVCGLSIIRGRPLPVVDLGILLGASVPGPSSRAGRLVVLKLGGHGAALAVESVAGIHVLPAAEIHELPPLLREAHPDWVAAVGRLDRELLLVLEASAVIPEECWRRISEGLRIEP
jgi:purine-binding chemotaxis protein CheW